MPLTEAQLAVKRASGLKGAAVAAEKRRLAALAPPVEPDPADHPAIKPPRPPSISPRVRIAIDAMVWKGMKRAQAAKYAGLKDNSLYYALKLPKVLDYLNEQMQVLRDSERPRNIHRAIQIRDKADNMPAMHAIKWLEGEQDQAVSHGRGGAAQSPGVTFVIVQGGSAPRPMRDVGRDVGTPRTIDAKPSDNSDLGDE